MQNQSSLNQKFVTNFIIYGAFLWAILIYNVLGYIVGQKGDMTKAQQSQEVLLSVLVGLTIVNIIAAPILKSIMLKKEKLISLSEEARLSRLTVTNIIVYALYEAIGIYGLLLVFITGNFVFAPIFTGVAFIGLLAQFPRKMYWENLVKLQGSS